MCPLLPHRPPQSLSPPNIPSAPNVKFHSKPGFRIVKVTHTLTQGHGGRDCILITFPLYEGKVLWYVTYMVVRYL